jgi:hypothetical protein
MVPCPLLVAAAILVGETPVAPSTATVAALSLDHVGSRGATVAFVELEAEHAMTTGRLIGPDRTFGTLPSEASGRKAVLLQHTGDYVEFTLARPANAITIRYAVPDGADGLGLNSTIGLYADGERLSSIKTSSKYGWFYGAYPFSNRPTDGNAHHFYDESRLLLTQTLPAGSRVRLMKAAQDKAGWYAIDLADFELVPPPKTPPAGALSIATFGADPAGKRDSWSAIKRAISAAKRRGVPVWIPPGVFRADRHIIVDGVTIAGAGAWHSTLKGNGVGLYGRRTPQGSRAVVLRDFAIIGEVTERLDKAQLAGIGGSIGGGSIIEDLWIQHHKVGVWLDGPANGLIIRRLRLVDHTADGLNLRGGVTNALVEHNFVRNSGDDGLAMWSHRRLNRGNAFRNNTVIAPILANGLAIYGGADIEVSGNVVADTVTQGGGIHLGNRFDAEPLVGRINLDDNLIVRAGSFDPNWNFGVGAIWFYALDHPITASISVRNTEIVDSTLPALHFIGKPITGVAFNNVRIRGTGSVPVQIQSAGTARFRAVVASDTTSGTPTCNSRFRVIDEGHNSGWETQC